MTTIRGLLLTGLFITTLGLATDPHPSSTVLSFDTLIPVGGLLTFAGCAWYLSHRLTRAEDRVTKVEADFALIRGDLRDLSDKLETLGGTLTDIKASLERLKTQVEERT